MKGEAVARGRSGVGGRGCPGGRACRARGRIRAQGGGEREGGREGDGRGAIRVGRKREAGSVEGGCWHRRSFAPSPD